MVLNPKLGLVHVSKALNGHDLDEPIKGGKQQLVGREYNLGRESSGSRLTL